MGGSRKAKVVNYDASIERAQQKSRSLELLNSANREALVSQKLAVYSGEQAVQDINEGLSLLGSYLKDRNNISAQQTPVYSQFLSDTVDRTQSYADKTSGVLSQISKGYVNNE